MTKLPKMKDMNILKCMLVSPRIKCKKNIIMGTSIIVLSQCSCKQSD